MVMCDFIREFPIGMRPRLIQKCVSTCSDGLITHRTKCTMCLKKRVRISLVFSNISNGNKRDRS